MDRSPHAEKPLGANYDRSSWSVAPEVLRASDGADAPAVVALCAPLHHCRSQPNLRPFIKGVEEDRDRPSPYNNNISSKILILVQYVVEKD